MSLPTTEWIMTPVKSSTSCPVSPRTLASVFVYLRDTVAEHVGSLPPFDYLQYVKHVSPLQAMRCAHQYLVSNHYDYWCCTANLQKTKIFTVKDPPSFGVLQHVDGRYIDQGRIIQLENEQALGFDKFEWEISWQKIDNDCLEGSLRGIYKEQLSFYTAASVARMLRAFCLHTGLVRCHPMTEDLIVNPRYVGFVNNLALIPKNDGCPYWKVEFALPHTSLASVHASIVTSLQQELDWFQDCFLADTKLHIVNPYRIDELAGYLEFCEHSAEEVKGLQQKIHRLVTAHQARQRERALGSVFL